MTHTLFDFITKVNSMQYLLVILFTGGFILLWEMLKPEPFKSFATSLAEDMRFLKQSGRLEGVKLIKSAFTAALLFGIYLVSIPVLFVAGLGGAVVRSGGAVFSGEWSPVEAYFTGRKKSSMKRKAAAKDENDV